MALFKKKKWITEEENERRRDNHLVENERNFHNQALKITNNIMMANLESEHVK